MRRLMVGALLVMSLAVHSSSTNSAHAAIVTGAESVAYDDLLFSMSHSGQVATTVGPGGMGVSTGGSSTIIDPNASSEHLLVTTEGNELIRSTRASLVAEDIDSQSDVYVRPTAAGTWALVTGALPSADYSASGVTINTGLIVVRQSFSGLPGGVFLLDTWTSRVTRLSPEGSLATGGSTTPNGRFVVFTASIVTDRPGPSHVYLYDVTNSTTRMIDVDPAGVVGNGNASLATISDDGEWIAFTSGASNLGGPDGVPPTPSNAHLYAAEVSTGEITLLASNVTLPSYDMQGNAADDWIDGAGTRVTYRKDDHVWVWDRSTNTSEQASSSIGIIAPSWPQLQSSGRAVLWRQYGATTGDYDTRIRQLTQPLDPPTDPPGLVPVPPRRLLDTRPTGNTVDGQFARGGLVAPGTTQRIRLAGRGGLDARASAVAVNVTVTGATGSGYLTTWPCDSVTPPNASNVNFGPGRDVPNLVLTPLDSDGFVCFRVAEASAHVLIDGSASFEPGSGYLATSPKRLFDSRPGGRTIDGISQGDGLVSPGANRIVRLDGRGGLPPARIGAVALNVTVTGATGAGYLTVWPCTGPEPPNASNLNFVAGRDVANVVIVKVSDASTLCFRTFGASAHVIADLNGRLPSGGVFKATNPQRLLDTRSGGFTIDGRFVGLGSAANGRTIEVAVAGRGGVPLDAKAVALNVTVTQPDAAGYLTVWPCDTANPPDASNLNFQVGQDIPNQVIAGLSPTGTICIRSTLASAHVLADLEGWF